MLIRGGGSTGTLLSAPLLAPVFSRVPLYLSHRATKYNPKYRAQRKYCKSRRLQGICPRCGQRPIVKAGICLECRTKQGLAVGKEYKRLTPAETAGILEKYAAGVKQVVLAREYGTSAQNVHRLVHGKR